jgi:hypothetical protein
MTLRNDDDRLVPSGAARRWSLVVAAVAAMAVMTAVTGCTTPVGIINGVFGPAAPQATRIAECESGLRPSAVSRTNDHGLFQINIVHQAEFTRVTGQPWSAVYDPYPNTRYAKALYDRQGWAPWTCKRVLGL